MNDKRHSILCPNCRKLISVDELRCPYCGTRRPGSWWKNNLWTQSYYGPEQLVKTIIYINLAIYFISLIFIPRASSLSLNPLTFLSPDSFSLLLLGATGTESIDRFPLYLKAAGITPLLIDRVTRLWTLLSANYLHGGVLHIFFNMFALRQLALLVVREYGPFRMIVIYTFGGVIGFWVSYLAGVGLTIGASAAVCALIGALLYYGKSRGGVYGHAIYRQIGGWAVGLFLFGLLVPGINNWGHGGGIVAGALLGFVLKYQEKAQENIVHKSIAAVCVIVTLITLGWAVLSSLFYRIMS
ncbi:MAG: rhomboid family intramembrane serine protease [Deltaproteobacteria bacterium]|nr:MAG: rhomboid family intramembrane serine protease [Deltaproteobacteria bacterium]